MVASTSLANQLLIAMPALADPNFARSVIYLCQHGEDGAMGIQLNRLADYRLGDILKQMSVSTELPEISAGLVLVGGPVQPERGFVLHASGGDWDSSMQITPELSLTTSRDVLESMAVGEGPKRVLIALGYAGWGPGQLEQELLDNSWLSAPADLDLIFDCPIEDRWQAAVGLIGIDPSRLAGYAGHA